MKHKYKIKQKIYVPRDPAVGHYVDDYDYIGLVIGYVEDFPFIEEKDRQNYLDHGFEYVCASVCPDCGTGYFSGVGDVFKEEEMVKYRGRSLDWMFYDFFHYDDFFDEEVKKINLVNRRDVGKPFPFWKTYNPEKRKYEMPVYCKEKGKYVFPSNEEEKTD